jgi:4'-phosphopantetheinyl transferase
MAVHVWRLRVPPEGAGLDALERLLDRAERDRAARFRVDGARRRFVAGRAGARIALGRTVGSDPRALRFATRCAVCGSPEHGKPFLAADGDGIDFSVSHSGELAVVAVGAGRAVGVDLERIRESTDVAGVARHVLSETERAGLEGLDDTERRLAFFRSWTCKEAYLKARGLGLAGGLDRWIVAGGAVSAADPGDAHAALGWRVRSFDPGPGYAGAAASDAPFELRVEDLPIDA